MTSMLLIQVPPTPFLNRMASFTLQRSRAGLSYSLLGPGMHCQLGLQCAQAFSLTLQGGWNGLNDGSGFALSGQTNFGANRVQIGTSGNPWAGNITINNFSINGVTGGAIIQRIRDLSCSPLAPSILTMLIHKIIRQTALY